MKAGSRLEELRRLLPMVYGALEDAFELGGCVVCQALRKVEQRSLFSFLYEGMMGADARQKFVEGGGFCPRHFRLAVSMGKGSGYVGTFSIAALCQPLITSTDEMLRTSAQRQPLSRAMRKKRAAPGVSPGENCVFCREGRDREQDLIGALETLREDRDAALLLKRNGLCRRHSQSAMDTWKQVDARKWLAEAIHRRTAELQKDLGEFLGKHDYRRRSEPPGREADVVGRAMEFLLGIESEAV